MTLQEAIKECIESNGKKWIRPICYRGLKLAYTISGHYILQVPDRRGGTPRMTYYVDEILDEWEVVEPDTVINDEH